MDWPGAITFAYHFNGVNLPEDTRDLVARRIADAWGYTVSCENTPRSVDTTFELVMPDDELDEAVVALREREAEMQWLARSIIVGAIRERHPDLLLSTDVRRFVAESDLDDALSRLSGDG